MMLIALRGAESLHSAEARRVYNSDHDLLIYREDENCHSNTSTQGMLTTLPAHFLFDTPFVSRIRKKI